jgi:hypothetical protein
MWDAEIQRTLFLGHSGQKSLRPYVTGQKPKLGVVACICDPSSSRKLTIEGSQFRKAWAKSETPSPK